MEPVRMASIQARALWCQLSRRVDSGADMVDVRRDGLDERIGQQKVNGGAGFYPAPPTAPGQALLVAAK